MSQQHSDLSSQSLQRWNPVETFPRSNFKSDNSRNINGKRSLDHLQKDQSDSPRKLARINSEHHREREQPHHATNQEQGFVAGPGRIIFIDERGKRCPAICFNEELLRIFNNMAALRRDLNEQNGAVQEMQSELERIRSTNRSTSVEEAGRLIEEAAQRKEAIEAGFPGMIEARRQHEALMQERDWSKLRLDNSRELAQLVIEQILKTENLMNIPSSKPQEPAEATKRSTWEPSPVAEGKVNPFPSAEREPETEQSPMDADQQTTPRQLALRQLRFEAEELAYLKEELAYMQEEYPQAIAAERRRRREQHPDRPASTTETDVDLITLQRTQQATRQLIEAEEAYDRAERHAEDLGLGDILADPHACYYGEIYNEFPPPRSEKITAMLPVHRSRIEAWMASVPDPVGANAQRAGAGAASVEVDDWDAKPVEVWDSVSVGARDVFRKKIDAGQGLAGRLRGE